MGACGDDDAPSVPVDAGTDASTLPPVRARFELRADPIAFGAIPFPDDLYRDATGKLSIGALPSEDFAPVPEYMDALRTQLSALDGFSPIAPAFFYFDGELDAATLPSQSASTTEEASVFLMDVDPASTTPSARMPVRIDWEGSLRQLAVRPAEGHPLVEGRRYAVVITDRVRGAGGAPLLASTRFASIRDATTRPSDAVDGEAYDHYQPVLSMLSTQGVTKEHVVALAVFHVQTITRDMRDARAVVAGLAAPAPTFTTVISGNTALDAALGTPAEDLPGLDVPGGVRHSHIAHMIHGTFPSPNFLSATPKVHGPFTRGSGGALEVKRTDTVPFTLFLPTGSSLAELRLVLYQHGLGVERSNSLAVVDTLAAAGYAVLAIDAPFHGLRTTAQPSDTRNTFTMGTSPDGFGDFTGGDIVASFAGIVDTLGEYPSFSPCYFRDAIRQSAVDLFSATRLVRAGSWTTAIAPHSALAGLSFANQKIGFIGYSLGGIIGTLFVTAEPEVGAALLGVTGGGLLHTITQSPPFNTGYLPLLLPVLGVQTPTESIDYAGYHPDFWPEIAIWQTVVDAGDPVAHGAQLKATALDVVMLMARDDETFNNEATEALARSIGAVITGGAARHTDLPMVSLPVRDNLSVGSDTVTRALFVHEVAFHGLLTNRSGVQRYVHPVAPPFVELASPTPIEGPIDGAQAQMLHFFESWRSGSPELIAPPSE